MAEHRLALRGPRGIQGRFICLTTTPFRDSGAIGGDAIAGAPGFLSCKGIVRGGGGGVNCLSGSSRHTRYFRLQNRFFSPARLCPHAPGNVRHHRPAGIRLYISVRHRRPGRSGRQLPRPDVFVVSWFRVDSAPLIKPCTNLFIWPGEQVFSPRSINNMPGRPPATPESAQAHAKCAVGRNC